LIEPSFQQKAKVEDLGSSQIPVLSAEGSFDPAEKPNTPAHPLCIEFRLIDVAYVT
jgi:hypothetical protein